MKKILIINTHTSENTEFVDILAEFLESNKFEYKVISGYDGTNPLGENPSHIILTGVPADANYSLAEPQTQELVTRAFCWLLDCRVPVLGICYGHQILAHVYEGKVSKLPGMVKQERQHLAGRRILAAGYFRISIIWSFSPNTAITSPLSRMDLLS